jgi:Fic family protein
MIDRSTVAEQAKVEHDPVTRARREAENGLRQAALATNVIRTYIKDPERPFRLTQGILLQLHHAALQGLHPLAGTFRNVPNEIHGSQHQTVEVWQVADEVAHMCDYVTKQWETQSALHLSAYVMWRVNWIHPFVDGNGRTARAVSYVVLNIKLDSLLPGSPAIPEIIDENKDPYYSGLEAADAAWKEGERIDVSELEKVIGSALSKQLLRAAEEAEGRR